MGKAENAVTKSVRAACAMRGAMVVRVQAGGIKIGDRFVRGAEAGTADLIGCYRGQAIALEVKTAKGVQQPLQVEWGIAWALAGGRYFLVRSGVDAMDALDSIDKEITCRK